MGLLALLLNLYVTLLKQNGVLLYFLVRLYQPYPLNLALGSLLLGGGAKEDRTPDLLRARQALSQLSYGPNLLAFCQDNANGEDARTKRT